MNPIKYTAYIILKFHNAKHWTNALTSLQNTNYLANDITSYNGN